MLSDYSLTSHTHSSYLTAVPDTYKTYVSTIESLSNDGYLTAHQSLSDYYEKSKTSSAVEISSAFDLSKQYADSSFLPLSGGDLSSDLSVTNADVYILSGNYI